MYKKILDGLLFHFTHTIIHSRKNTTSLWIMYNRLDRWLTRHGVGLPSFRRTVKCWTIAIQLYFKICLNIIKSSNMWLKRKVLSKAKYQTFRSNLLRVDTPGDLYRVGVTVLATRMESNCDCVWGGGGRSYITCIISMVHPAFHYLHQALSINNLPTGFYWPFWYVCKQFSLWISLTRPTGQFDCEHTMHLDFADNAHLSIWLNLPKQTYMLISLAMSTLQCD